MAREPTSGDKNAAEVCGDPLPGSNYLPSREAILLLPKIGGGFLTEAQMRERNPDQWRIIDQIRADKARRTTKKTTA